MEAFLVQEGSYIDASKDEMLAEYGSQDGYVSSGLRFTGQELENLRAELLE